MYDFRVSPADNFCKQFGPKLGPIQKVWHSVRIAEIFFEKKYFEKKN